MTVGKGLAAMLTDNWMLTLNPEFRGKVKELLLNCSKRGVTVAPFYGTRTPKEQAKLWAQSRSAGEIKEAASKLQAVAPNVVKCILSVEPLSGRWATNLLPGQSWHQWGEAMDCCVLNTVGQAVWQSQHPGYAVYTEEAIRLGLTSGALWKSRDVAHIQLRKDNVRDLYAWKEIEQAMYSRFSML